MTTGTTTETKTDSKRVRFFLHCVRCKKRGVRMPTENGTVYYCQTCGESWKNIRIVVKG